ncbi:MAG: hypothetical protein ABI882_23050 [Acidobacteriota bacterium]
MRQNRDLHLTCMACINGLGLGILLAGLREFEELDAAWEYLLDPPFCSLGSDVRPPCIWIVIPSITAIGIWWSSKTIIRRLPELSRFSLRSWVMVGLVSLGIVLPLMLLMSTHRSLSKVGLSLEVLRVFALVYFYEIWFGLILVLARQSAGLVTDNYANHRWAEETRALEIVERQEGVLNPLRVPWERSSELQSQGSQLGDRRNEGASECNYTSTFTQLV